MRSIQFSLIAAGVLVAAAVALPPAADASHVKRIVWPYGVDERWVPVIAGYEVAPRPHPCGVGPGVAKDVLFVEDFEGPGHALTIVDAIPQAHSGNRNLFHVTSFPGKGTDDGHSAPNRLYMGIATWRDGAPEGTYANGFRIGGAAVLPPLVVPDAPTMFLSWNEKFEVEALLGYDHMWVELEDASGQIYILCSSDVESRPDKSSNSHAMGACSPYRVGVCPTSVRGSGGLDCIGIPGVCIHNPYAPDLGGLPAEDLDPDAPHWHARHVEIPSLFAGETVRLRFTVDTADGVSNNFMGWMIDDILVSSAVRPEAYVHLPPGVAPED